MEYRVLGPLEVYDGERSMPLAGAKQRGLLALLLVHANHVLSRDRLIDELWGEQPPGTAVPSLQVYVSRLRKLLPPDTLLTRPPGYLLEVEPDELDLRRFERLLAEGRAALAAGNPEDAAAVLQDALALWRGPALAEFAFEPFAQAEIGRLEDLRLAAVEERIEADLSLARHADLIGELEALIAENRNFGRTYVPIRSRASTEGPPRRAPPRQRIFERNSFVRSWVGATKKCSGVPSSIIRPSSIISRRSAASRAKPISCVTTIMVVLKSTARLFITSSTSPTSSGSSADVGSSKSISFGCIASALAIATRCCCPPDSCAG